jgi:hypothetical protein
MEDPRLGEIVETQGITVQRDAAGMTQLRRLAAEINPHDESLSSPLMILRSEKNHRRFELHNGGKMVLTIEPDGAMRVTGTSSEVYEAFRTWMEMAAGE